MTMKALKKILLFLSVCLVLTALQQPLTALAKEAGVYYQRLIGEWGSAGGMADRIIVEHKPEDNPKYVCQWQLFNYKSFEDGAGLGFQKVSWATFEVDTENKQIDSANLKWTVALVYNPDDSFERNEDRTIMNSGTANDSVQTDGHSVYLSFLSNFENSKTYNLSFSLNITQEIKDLVVSDYKNTIVDRGVGELSFAAGISARSADPNEKLNPLHSSVHCQKLN